MFKNIIDNFNLISKENAVFDIHKFVNWKKKTNQYNFTNLPKTALITLSKSSLNKRFFYKKITGLQATSYLINENIIFCANFGMGGPAIITLLEELKELKVERCIFIGLAGIIKKGILENELFVVENSFSTVGASFFYNHHVENKVHDYNWATKIKDILTAKFIAAWSTDCPFKETPSLINHFEKAGAALVDMETAAIYAFSNYHLFSSVCVLVSADSLIDNSWTEPKNMHSIQLRFNQIVKLLIKNIDNSNK